MINNFGSTTSINNICDSLKKNGLGIGKATVSRYINALVDAKILYECDRFDMKSKKSLSGENIILPISDSIMPVILTIELIMDRHWRIFCMCMHVLVIVQ